MFAPQMREVFRMKMFTRLNMALLAVPALVGSAFVAHSLIPAANAQLTPSATASLKAGKADLKSAGSLAFGPSGVLFVGDTAAGKIFALDTADTQAVANAAEVSGVNLKIAALLGTTPDQIIINDVTVNPLSKRAYLSVSRGTGPEALPAIVRTTTGGNVELVSLDNIKNASVTIPNAVDKPDQRGRPQRNLAITDMAYVNGQVVVAGLSNEEFASNLRSIAYPFAGNAAKGTSVEIYHGSHGRFETQAPVRTFTSYRVNGEDVILASYTCTPLVMFKTAELAQNNGKVMGKTIAELGAGNTPLDMVIYEKGGKPFILMANSARGVMKVSADNLGQYPAITKQTEITGTPYETLAELKGVAHLERLDDNRALMLVADAGNQSLKALPLP
jgi:hypothetical protein